MANVTFTANPVPAPACYPPDLNGLAQELTSGGILNGTIPDSAGGGLTSGSTAPSSALTNKLWLKTDVAGRPLGLYAYYNGNWRKVYTGVGVGEIRMFHYPPTEFDGTGRGTVGGNWDGWAICNGNNATPNLQTLYAYPMSGYWNGSAWVGWDPINGWQSQGGQGVYGHKLTGQDLPPMGVWTYGDRLGAIDGNAGVYQDYPGTTRFADWPVHDRNTQVDTGTNQKPLPLPNYFVVGFLMFVGYQ